MVCEEKMRLLAEYREATSARFAAVTELNLKTGVEKRRAFEVSEATRAKCVMARSALREHKVQHGC
jgi:hypothetical protein